MLIKLKASKIELSDWQSYGDIKDVPNAYRDVISSNKEYIGWLRSLNKNGGYNYIPHFCGEKLQCLAAIYCKFYPNVIKVINQGICYPISPMFESNQIENAKIHMDFFLKKVNSLLIFS